MKLALFADIHSNLEALTACLAHANAIGADRYAFLGDLLGYGADPVRVLELIEEHARGGAVVVLGNHDAAVLGRPDDTLNVHAQAAPSSHSGGSAASPSSTSPSWVSSTAPRSLAATSSS